MTENTGETSSAARTPKQRATIDFGWKAALGAVAAYLLNTPVAFGALLAIVAGSCAVYLLEDLREERDHG